MKKYLGFFVLLMLRGYVVSLNPVHGTEAEIGTSRIGTHMRKKFIIYIFTEILKQGIKLDAEGKKIFLKLFIASAVNKYKFIIQAFYLSISRKG